MEAPLGLLPARSREQFTCTGYRCDLIGIIYSKEQGRLLLETLCEEHMGNHRWIEEGTVWQWKADPVFVRAPKPLRRRRTANFRKEDGSCGQ